MENLQVLERISMDQIQCGGEGEETGKKLRYGMSVESLQICSSKSYKVGAHQRA